MASVIIPAHNEAAVVGRLLSRLAPAVSAGDLEVVVVPNGCTDGTAAAAARFGPRIKVISLSSASKRDALAAGDRAACSFPRVYVDADVEVGAADVRKLVDALRLPGVLAAAPRRVFALADRPWPVRWYYDVWERLPHVRRGLFGRGVIAVTEAGHRRIADWPPLQADDLVVSLRFAPAERTIVPGASVLIHPPRTFGDLLRRRVRAAVQAAQMGRAWPEPAALPRTRLSDLWAIARGRPPLAPRVAFFLLVAVLARLRARHAVTSGDYSGWLRDESSRQDPGVAGLEARDGQGEPKRAEARRD